MAGHSGGPWGGGGSGNSGNSGGGNDRDRKPNGGQRPGEQPIPEIDEIVKKGQEQLRVIFGGNGGGSGSNGAGPSGGGGVPTRVVVMVSAFVAVGLWLAASVYTVRPEERSVNLLLGEYWSTGNPGLNIAPWPLVTYEKVNVTSERTEIVGSENNETGMMLTTDANIVDIEFQVVWNINNPSDFLFNIRDAKLTVQAVSESVMREIIAASTLAPILNRDRGVIADAAAERIQATLNEYEAGISIVRVNLEEADPPDEVIDAFREVQAAEQERDRLEREADAYANRVVAEARGSAAAIREDAEAYRAQVVNEAVGQASRFESVLAEFEKAPEVTRQRLYIETMERVLANVDKTIIDDSVTGQGGVVPYLPLNELRRGGN